MLTHLQRMTQRGPVELLVVVQLHRPQRFVHLRDAAIRVRARVAMATFNGARVQQDPEPELVTRCHPFALR